jgi:hypothetical protein
VTFCCVQCRLLQSATTAGCAECGSPMVAPVELVRELLYYRDLKGITGRDWGMITALVAGSSIAFPVLTPVALASMAALGVHKLRTARKRRAIAGIELAPPVPAPGATVIHGEARKFRATISSLFDREPALAEHVELRDRGGALLLRRTTSAPFWLEPEGGGDPVLVIGASRRWSTRPAMRRLEFPLERAMLRELGVPDDVPIRGDLEISTIREAAAITVVGRVEQETVAELAFHRDGGRVQTLRGVRGAPLVVTY